MARELDKYEGDAGLIVSETLRNASTGELDDLMTADSAPPVSPAKKAAAKRMVDPAVKIAKTIETISVLKGQGDEGARSIVRMAQKTVHMPVLEAAVSTLIEKGEGYLVAAEKIKAGERQSNFHTSHSAEWSAVRVGEFRLPAVLNKKASAERVAVVVTMLQNRPGLVTTIALGEIARKFPESADGIIRILEGRNTQEAYKQIVMTSANYPVRVRAAMIAYDKIDNQEAQDSSWMHWVCAIEKDEARAVTLLQNLEGAEGDMALNLIRVTGAVHDNLLPQSIAMLQAAGTDDAVDQIFSYMKYRPNRATLVIPALAAIGTDHAAELIADSLIQHRQTKNRLVTIALAMNALADLRDQPSEKRSPEIIEEQLGKVRFILEERRDVIPQLLKSVPAEEMGVLRQAFARADRTGDLARQFDAASAYALSIRTATADYEQALRPV